MATRSLEILKATEGVVLQRAENDGVVRMKILVKRQELKQVLDQVAKKTNNVKDGNNDVNLRRLTRSPASKSLEQRLKDMKRIRIVRGSQVHKKCGSYWRPALQSIPESGLLSY